MLMKSSVICDVLPGRAGLRDTAKTVRDAILFLLLTFLPLTSVFASPNTQVVSLSYKNASLQQVFKEINRQTKFQFFCKDAILDAAGRVSIEVKDVPVEEALKQCLYGKGLSFRIEGTKIIVKPRQEELSPVPQAAPDQKEWIITGKVFNEKGDAMQGISILVKGTTRGTSSKQDGTFSLQMQPGDKELVFSGAGMQTEHVSVVGKSTIQVTMIEKAAKLDDVVVTGIVNRKATSFTGASSTFTREELFKVNNKNIIQGLRVLEPSLMMLDNLTNGSDPNQLPDMSLRGNSSFPQGQNVDLKGGYLNNPNLPLFILDGFEISLTKMIDLDMNRIETVTILKDASAKALYGSKAANGVVVIETKRLVGSQMRINYNGSFDLEAPDLSSYNLMNSAEKLEAEKIYGLYSQNPGSVPNYQTQLTLDQQYNRRLEAVLAGVNTDWMSKPLTNGLGQKHALSIELGEKDLRVIADFSYNKISGVMIGSARNTLATSITTSYRYKRFLFRNILNITGTKSDDSPYGTFSEYSRMNPYWTPYDEFGNLKANAETGKIPYIGTASLGNLYAPNPLYNSKLNTILSKDYLDVTDNFYTEYNIATGLKAQLRGSLTTNKSQADQFYPANHLTFQNYTGADFFRKGSYKRNEGDQVNYSGDLNVNYSKPFGEKHFLFANIGGNIGQKKYEEVIYSAEGFPNDRMTNILFANQYSRYSNRPTGFEATNRDLGVLSIANYSYDDRFFVDASYRMNASSLFGANNRWGSFWSTGAGWNLHNEKFLQNTGLFERLKLRGSIGSTGSQNFSSYQSIATYKYFLDRIYQNYLGAYLMGMSNSDLKWQQKMDYNIGLDMNIRKKLILRLDYYKSITENTLIDYTLPPSTGFATVKENLGQISNTGIEGVITYNAYSNPKTRSFLSFTLSGIHNENKIVAISDALKTYNEDQDKIANDRFNNKPVSKFYNGLSMDAIWAVRSLGIDPANGQEIYLDRNGNKTYTYSAADQVVVGDKMPKIMGTAGVSAEFKGFGFNLFFRYMYGAQLYNQTLVDRVENVDMSFNVDKRVLSGTWQRPGDLKPYKALGSVEIQNPDGSWSRKFIRTQPSDRFVQDRNEFTLASLNISYDFYRAKWVKKGGIERLRLAFYTNDAFMLSSIRVERGLAYPFARKMSFSIQTTF